VAGLEGKRIVITGGSSGIGLATAILTAQAGAQEIVLIGRDEAKLKAACSKIKNSRFLSFDVANENAVKAQFKDIGKLDHLVTAAAGTYRGRITEVDTQKARALFDSKFWGQHHCVKHGASHMSPDGSITLFSGWISRKPAIGTGTLAAIDGAIESLTRVLSLELAPLRINAINPGQIDTPLWASRFTAEQQKDHFERAAKDLPVGRHGNADDVAAGILFLMQNRFVTGSVLDIDGGQPWGRHA
jgi:NAD(P)-dependent dehydrogenase (short-subunit alcohol dehydrogenase family)